MSEPKEAPNSTNGNSDEEVAQRFERSLEFWASGKEDYPPAVRGVMADISDLPENVQHVLQRIAKDSNYPELSLKRLLWFEDKNDKLDDACAEGSQAFRPFAVNAFGLISTNAEDNPLMPRPSRHRLVVSDEFAAQNYNRSDDLIVDDEESDKQIAEKSWKRKITQTLKCWAEVKSGRLVHVRPEDDLLLTLNELFSRTQHGWLVVDMFKLRERRGAILTYARTFEYQKRDSQAFEFKVELFGVSKELARFQNVLDNLGCVYVDVDANGDAYLTKASALPNLNDPSRVSNQPNRTAVELNVRVVLEPGKPSQLELTKSDEFYETQVRKLIAPGRPSTHKFDLRKATGDGPSRFALKFELDAPLLIATSGDAVIFQLDDMLMRFAETNLANIRARKEKKS